MILYPPQHGTVPSVTRYHTHPNMALSPLSPATTPTPIWRSHPLPRLLRHEQYPLPPAATPTLTWHSPSLPPTATLTPSWHSRSAAIHCHAHPNMAQSIRCHTTAMPIAHPNMAQSISCHPLPCPLPMHPNMAQLLPKVLIIWYGRLWCPPLRLQPHATC